MSFEETMKGRRALELRKAERRIHDTAMGLKRSTKIIHLPNLDSSEQAEQALI